ncbi:MULTISPECIES: hypothetical protein [Bacillota]|uniref:hypothetical protein n=1 Tax=Bacillota TaxID=1239 RepID=UPI0039F0091B
MGKAQFAQKVEPVLNEQLSQLINRYTEEGRIKEKGEILALMYNDHLTLEQKRQAKELMFNTDELDNHLRRIEEIFLQSSKGYHSKMEIMTKRYEDQKKLLEEKIEELEKVIQVQKEHLNEKIIALYEANKQLEKLQKKLKGSESKNFQH